jgi:hypothetical protein
MRDESSRTGKAFPHNAALSLVGLASVAAARGDSLDAAHMLGRASVLLEATGADLTGYLAETYVQTDGLLRRTLGAEAFAESYQAGRAMARPECPRG